MKYPQSYQERNKAEATIVFIDIVAFSATSEKLRDSVQELSSHLERTMDTIVEKLVAHDLIIDKFIGDAVMAFRGGPLVDGDAGDHARRVVAGALEAAEALKKIDDPYFSRVKVGGASGECLIGAFGTSKRLSYTVLGDPVNLASRLEPASAQCGVQALFCDRTHSLCGEIPGIRWRRWGTVRVKGKKDPQTVWEALLEARDGEMDFIPRYEKARSLFEQADPRRARPLFVETDKLREGGDPPSRLHIEWCDNLEKEGSALTDAALFVSK